MKVEIISSTSDPERLACTAARNDYSTDGVIEHDFVDLMDDVSVDDEFIETVLDERGYSRATRDMAAKTDTVLLEAAKRSLLKRMMDRGHWGPFEHPSATVSIENITRTAMAQITRHRHFTFDIMSLRYVKVDGDEVCAKPTPDDIRVSREGVHDVDVDAALQDFNDSYQESVADYEKLIEDGVSQEEARKVLPMGTQINMVMTGNARAWMHLLNIRGKANVQGEARRIADALMSEMKDWMQFTFNYYDEEVLPLQLNP